MSDLITKITQFSVAERILLIQEILNTIAVDTKESLTTALKKEIDILRFGKNGLRELSNF